MLTLRELQSELGGALLAGHDEEPCAALGAEILDDGLSAGARLAVYRHHVLATLTSVLRDTYPVVTPGRPVRTPRRPWISRPARPGSRFADSVTTSSGVRCPRPSTRFAPR